MARSSRELTGGLGRRRRDRGGRHPGDVRAVRRAWSGPAGHVANIGVHGKPATLHLEDLWISNVTITTGLVDTYSTPTLLRLVAAHQIDAGPVRHAPLRARRVHGGLRRLRPRRRDRRAEGRAQPVAARPPGRIALEIRPGRCRARGEVRLLRPRGAPVVAGQRRGHHRAGTGATGRPAPPRRRAAQPDLLAEPLGLVMAEALACGTPVLAFPHGATPEIVDDGCTGYLCADEDEMVEATVRPGRPRP